MHCSSPGPHPGGSWGTCLGGRGSPGPHPGGSWGVWPGGVSRPTPGGSPGPHPVGVSQHALKQTPPSRRECILVNKCNFCSKIFSRFYMLDVCRMYADGLQMHAVPALFELTLNVPYTIILNMLLVRLPTPGEGNYEKNLIFFCSFGSEIEVQNFLSIDEIHGGIVDQIRFRFQAHLVFES